MNENSKKTSPSRARAPEDEIIDCLKASGQPADAPDGALPDKSRTLNAPGDLKRALEAGEISLERLVENVRNGLTAMRPVVRTKTKGSGKDRKTWQEIEYEPDYATRLKWQEYVTHTVEGLPVKRQEIVSRRLTTEDELMRQVRSSPAMRRALRSILDDLEEKKR